MDQIFSPDQIASLASYFSWGACKSDGLYTVSDPFQYIFTYVL